MKRAISNMDRSGLGHAGKGQGLWLGGFCRATPTGRSTFYAGKFFAFSLILRRCFSLNADRDSIPNFVNSLLNFCGKIRAIPRNLTVIMKRKKRGKPLGSYGGIKLSFCRHTLRMARKCSAQRRKKARSLGINVRKITEQSEHRAPPRKGGA